MLFGIVKGSSMEQLTDTNKIHIPVFYACDENYIKYTAVSIYTLKKHASRDYIYDIHIMHAGMAPENNRYAEVFSEPGFNVSFDDVSVYLDTIADKLPVRDYFSKTTYYRFFISEMFPEYRKAIYIDSDTVVRADISELYSTDITGWYLLACNDPLIEKIPLYSRYAEEVVGVSRNSYLQAGVMLINCERFRTGYVLDKFFHLLQNYMFIVAQDQDYLNVICKDHVLLMDRRWNCELSIPQDFPIEEAKILHYNMAQKPWYYPDVPYAELFWAAAKETPVYDEIVRALNDYPDERRLRDALATEMLNSLVIKELDRQDNFMKQVNRIDRSEERVAITKKIEQFELEGRFDEDVESDPPGRVLLPEEIDYIRRGIGDKLKTSFAFMMARQFMNNLISDKKLIIKEIRGAENFKKIEGGAIITCNHFNAFDSFAVQFAYEAGNNPQKKLYRIIKEGNYTSFPGFYGFLMRHCNTLPLSSNSKTLAKFMDAARTILAEGNFILVYPEQSMWWNYRKPKPLKTGAFTIAARNNVPVLPVFITMKDSDIVGDDGFYVQEYTINISEPIYPDPSLRYKHRVEDMRDRNYRIWKDVYEKFYQIPLTYTTLPEYRGAQLSEAGDAGND